MTRTTRRRFLQQSLVAGGVLATPRLSLANVSANEQVNLGFIGLGWRGGTLLEAFKKVPNVNIAALCDPDSELVDKWAESEPQAAKFTDLRGLLELKEVDAVVVATCNHWHCLAAQWAMEAGKHVYVEKPLANALWEGRQVVESARKHNRVCQIGTQQRSSPIQSQIKALLHEDKALGEIQWVRMNRHGVRQPIGKRTTPLEPPKSVDYNLWLGPAQDQPLLREKFHYDWHWDWNTGAGEMGNWGVHVLDDIRNTVFLDRVTHPRRIVSAGGRYGWNDAGNTPNLHFALLDTGDIPLAIGLTNLAGEPGGDKHPACPDPRTGYIVHCEGGRLEGQRGMGRAFDSDGKLLKEIKGNEGTGIHTQNFIDAVRADSSSNLNGPVEQGHYSSAWCSLANYACRVAESDSTSPVELSTALDEIAGDDNFKATAAEMLESYDKLAKRHAGADTSLKLSPVLHFDPASEQFTGELAPAANEFLRVEGRGKFAVQPA